MKRNWSAPQKKICRYRRRTDKSRKKRGTEYSEIGRKSSEGHEGKEASH